MKAWLALAGVAALPLGAAWGQDTGAAAIRVDHRSAAGPPSPLSSAGQVTIQASQTSSAAVAVIAFRSGPKIEISTPLAKDAERTDFASLDGLANGLAAAFSFHRPVGALRPRGKNARGAVPTEAVCLQYKLQNNCDGRDLQDSLQKHGRKGEISEALRVWDSAFFEKGSASGISVNAKLGYKEFTFFSAAAAGEEVHRVGQSITVTGYHVSGSRRISLGLSGERAYRDQKRKVQKCQAVAESSALESCDTRPFGEPAAETELIARAELRQLGTAGLAPLVSWRIRENVVGVDLPIYFVADAAGQLTGGVRLGWRSDDDLQVAVFVSKPLSLF